jgi:hypothetical protein
MKTITIPPTERHPVGKDGQPEPDAEATCPSGCPFHHSDDVGACCTMKWAQKGTRRFYMRPGPDCPGPGEHALEKVVRCRADAVIFSAIRKD